MYAEGHEVSQDFTQAVTWYRRAADQGDVGFAGAQLSLGHMYADGQGVPRDFTQAIAWYRQAADQSDAEAQFMLGSMYAAGIVLDQDAVEAAQGFLRSAEQGYARSFLPLGRAYLNGQGVAQDYVSAHLWFNIAAARLSGEDRAVAVAERPVVVRVVEPAPGRRVLRRRHPRVPLPGDRVWFTAVFFELTK